MEVMVFLNFLIFMLIVLYVIDGQFLYLANFYRFSLNCVCATRDYRWTIDIGGEVSSVSDSGWEC
jgi:hypothetical protein